MNCNPNAGFDIQGHRGCRGLLPENSLPSFQKAVELGVTTLELDLAISKDKKVVVSHEPFISRTYCLDANGLEILAEDDKKYNLYEMTFEEIKAFDCGTKIHSRFPDQRHLRTYKPLLSEVIELSDSLNPNIRYNIELKASPNHDDVYTPKPKEFVELVMEVVMSHGISERCNLQSFDTRILNEIKKQAPNIRVAILVDGSENIEGKMDLLNFKPEIISPTFELLNKENIKAFHEKGYLIVPWTVNEPNDMKTMLSYEVDGIITDYPDRLIKLLTNY